MPALMPDPGDRRGGDPVEALARELDLRPVVRAYLFGSQATGRSGALSDVDLAVLPEPSVPPTARLDLQSRLSLLAFAAIRGRLLLDKRPETREAMEARIMSVYHDRRAKEDRWEATTAARHRRGEFA